jgi:hypothetical protein
MIINANHKGRNTTGDYAYRPLLEPEPDDFVPNSRYWELRMLDATERLMELMGTDSYLVWIDAELTDEDTAKDVERKASEKIHDLSIAKELKKT